MISDEQKQAIRDLYAKVSDALPGFKKRRGQGEMIAVAGNIFGNAGAADGANIAVIEGKTGVGKTVGYLVPALVMSKALGKKLVLSTGTVALQEQLYGRDLPAVLSAFDDTKIALLKGRNRFACPVKLDQLGGGAGQEALFGDAAWDRRPEDTEIRWLRKTSQEFADGKWNGEIDTLPSTAPGDLWQRIANTRHGCVGRRCSSYQVCPYFKSLDEVRAADVIVANHDLVLACIAASSKLLPSPDNALYVFDEAHHLPSVALNRFAEAASTSAHRWIDRIPAAYTRLIAAVPSISTNGSLSTRCAALARDLADLETSLRHNPALKEKGVFRFKGGLLDAQFMGLAQGLLNQCDDILKTLAGMHEAMNDATKENPTLSATLQPALADAFFAFSRLAHLHKALTLFAAEPADNYPLAKWINVEDGRSGGFLLNASPILSGPILRNLVWNRVSAAVLTSATLTSLGKFDFFLRDAGLNQLSNVTAISVTSPFDYQSQGELVFPVMSSDPSNSDHHTAELASLLPGHLEDVKRGALVLFASKKQMLAIHDALPKHARTDILVQGDQARSKLIATHVERVRSGKRSIIFGMAGFGEGLDLPGELCEHVLIAKIPFSPPDSPIEEARSEWIEQRGGNPFLEITLPKAGLILIQWVGRLIRTENDFGRVVLFDPRVKTKRYGKQLISSLPPFRQLAH